MLHMPIYLNQTTGEYTVYGNFCSLECMKAYNAHNNDSYKHNRFSLITKMYNLYNTDIQLAPPREALKCFGGNLTINEFRKSNGVFSNLNIPPMTKLSLQTDGDKNLSQVSNFTWLNNNTSNDKKEEDTGLYRKAPLKNQNTLDQIMGINLKK